MARAAATPDFGSNVTIFSPGQPLSQIQTAVDAVAAQQISNQFGPQRHALLFMPGTYGSAAHPLNFKVGYGTMVAGLGRSPGDVTINGSVNVYNQCAGTRCVALDNFWRSLSNLTVHVNAAGLGCYNTEFWAVSQAAPMRRVRVANGNITLADGCTAPSYASGGFIADSQFDGTVINGGQQQFFIRNSRIGSWSNGVWNQVFSGVVGAPQACFGGSGACAHYTTLASSPVTREAPYLYQDTPGHFSVFVPSVQYNAVGTSWAVGPTPGQSVAIESFFIAKPTDTAAVINAALASGKNLLLTPGVYTLDQSLQIRSPGTVVLGLGFPTLIPSKGTAAMTVGAEHGVVVAGVIFDAGPMNSPVLLTLGCTRPAPATCGGSVPGDPTALHDVFFRIGGARAGRATISLVVNSDNVILDDVWAWRADHGAGVGWTANTADTGVVVNGNNVTAYGLFVEHYQKTQVNWIGNGGTVVFFQNEMPYDPPSQAAWMEAPGVNGWPAFRLDNSVTRFSGYGMGSYSFFNHGVNIVANRAFEVPATLPKGSLHDLVTFFLNGSGSIKNVVNSVGAAVNAGNRGPAPVVSYP